MSGERHAAAALPHYIGGWVVPWAGVDGCRKSRPTGIFFLVFSCTSSLSWFPCILPFLSTYNTQHNIHAHVGILFCSLSCTLSVLLCPDCPGFAFCPDFATRTTQTSMPSEGLELAISTSDRPKTFALDRSATGIGIYFNSEKDCYRALTYSAIS